MPNSWASPDNLRFEELLPFFVTGHLSAADHSFMQGFISANPSAKQSVSFAMELGRVIRHTGVMRNPNATLSRLLANFNTTHASKSGILGKLTQKGGKKTLPILFAIVILGGQAAYYGINNIDWKKASDASSAKGAARVAISLKPETSVAALAAIANSYGGKIVHSSTVDGTKKVFVELTDPPKLEPFVQALVNSGLVESAAVLF